MPQSKRLWLGLSIGLLALLGGFFKHETKSMLMATFIQSRLFSNVYFGWALLANGMSGDRPHLNVHIGYFNNLQMKTIWLSRYFSQDQFLFKDWESRVHRQILDTVTEQYKQLNLTEASITTQVPTFQWGEIDKDTFLRDYVQRGFPVIIKGFPSKAAKVWSSQYFASTYGSHKIEAINTSAIVSVQTTLADFIRNTENGEPLYVRSLSDIFDKHKELIDDVGFHTFDDYMSGNYMTSQIFMSNSLKKGSGTSYHCANFNNLFFQINGRKKWTFVDPQHEAMMYPMFNAKMMDVASFLTTVVLAQPEVMEKYYPLYKLAPKMEAILEPGDILMNPPWNWHMVILIFNHSTVIWIIFFLPPFFS